MSNLKLPNMDYMSLINMLDKEDIKTVAYQTRVMRFYDEITVRHWNSNIATIRTWSLFIDTHGYNTKTTTFRLNRILQDNNVPFYVAIRNEHTTLLDRNRNEIDGLVVARFEMIAGEWQLRSLNGEELDSELVN